jgi:hypothetical protein
MVTARTVGIGRDNSDKGANKAATAAWKYLLLHLFAIGDRADDSDGHDYDDARTARTPSPAEVVFDMCRTADPATKGRLKALAESTGRKLTVAALTAEPEWLLVVGAELKEGTHHV